MTIGIIFITSPIIPGTLNNGEKAAIVVKTAKITGVATLCVPEIAAFNGSSPRCRWE